MHPMCLKSTPDTSHFDLFFRFFNAVFGDPDLCYACPSVQGEEGKKIIIEAPNDPALLYQQMAMSFTSDLL